MNISNLPVIYRLDNICKKYKPSNAVGLENFTIDVYESEVVGLVGESGSGKSTCAKIMARLETIDSGKCIFEQEDISHCSDEKLFRLRKRLQFIFQDPAAALNPVHMVKDILFEPLYLHAEKKDNRESWEDVLYLLDRVGLPISALRQFPHQFSGGQKHRIALARSLILRPKLLICDEPLAALDLSIQAQIIRLLLDLREEFSLTIIIVAHDLLVLRQMCDRIGVMYSGNLVELGPVESIYAQARHPYTQMLIDCIPIPNPTIQRKRTPRILTSIDWSITKDNEKISERKGCPFANRCPFAMEKCFEEKPHMRSCGKDHSVACHLIQPSNNETT